MITMTRRLARTGCVVLLVFLGLGARQALGCTSLLVSRGASADGSVMITYSADSHVRYGELYLRRGGTWPKGSTVLLRDRGSMKPLGEVPQAEETYTVIGFMNENAVAIAESTFGGRKELVDPSGVMDYGSLMFLAMDRARNAREAIKVIAELVEAYGYHSTGESFSIADPDEVWIMEIIGKGVEMVTDEATGKEVNAHRGAVWVARRIPDGYVSAHANQARITTFPLANGTTSITSRQLEKIFDRRVEVVYAHDVIEVARRRGYFAGLDEAFSFSDAYAPLDFEAARFCEIRVWSFFKRFCAGMDRYTDFAAGHNLANRMPLWVKPERPLTLSDLMAAKRDHLEGTPFDLRLDAGAGPHRLPYRWRPLTWEYEGRTYVNERATATQQTGFSFIAQLRRGLPPPIGGILWFGVDDAATSVYVPMYAGITRVPSSMAEGNGDMLTYSETSAFWAFNAVAHLAYLRYDRVSEDIRRLQQELEEKFRALVPAIDTAGLALWRQNPSLAREFLTEVSVVFGEGVVQRWRELYRYLLVKYLDGNVKREKDGVFERNPWGFPVAPEHPPYPEAWRRLVVQDTGDKLLKPVSPAPTTNQ